MKSIRWRWVVAVVLVALTSAAWAFGDDRWQAAGAVATAGAALIALFSGYAAIDLEREALRDARRERAAERQEQMQQADAARSATRAMILNELQDVLEGAMRLRDYLPGTFDGVNEPIERDSLEIADRDLTLIYTAATHVRNPVSEALGSSIGTLSKADLDALGTVSLLVGNIHRFRWESMRREQGSAATRGTIPELIDQIADDNEKLIQEITALRDSWRIGLDSRSFERVAR